MTAKKNSPLCIKQHMQHFEEQFSEKGSKRGAGRHDPSWPDTHQFLQIRAPPASCGLGALQQTNVAIFTKRRVVDLRKVLMASHDRADNRPDLALKWSTYVCVKSNQL